VNALANPSVGEYFANNFVSAFQKVGSFRIAKGAKQGGNVASYFCTPQGQVLDIVAGPVNVEQLLREARWVVETWKLGELQNRTLSGRKALFAAAHAERLQRELNLPPQLQHHVSKDITYALAMQHYNTLDKEGKVHALLIREPLAPIKNVYEFVFEKILNQRVSTDPVQVQ